MAPTRSFRRAAVLLAFTLAASACGGASNGTTDPADATTDPGGQPPQQPTAAPGGPAQPPTDTLELGGEYTHTAPADATGPIMFTFDVPPGSIVQVDATAAAANRGQVSLGTATPSGLNLRVDLRPGQSGSTRPWITSDQGGGRWVLEINAAPGDSVTFSVNAPLQADGGGSGDAGGHAGTAAPIALGERLSGLLGDEDREDWYAVPLAGGDVVSVTLEVPPDERGSTTATLVYNGRPLRSIQANPGGTASMTQLFAQDQLGTAQVQFAGTGVYEFTVEAGPQRDGGTEGDAGSDLATAKRIEFGLVEGIIGGEDREDWYVFSLPLDAVIRMEASIAPDFEGTARVDLIHNGKELIRESMGAGASRDFLYAIVNAADENLYLRVANGAGSYTVTIAATTQPDGDGTGDAPSERGLAKEVQPSGSFNGIVNNRLSVDPHDWYRFQAVQTGTLVLELTVDAEANSQVRLLVYEGTRGVGDITVQPGTSNAVTLEVTAGATYEFQLQSPGQAPYTVTFR
jgi:hypothetical protein